MLIRYTCFLACGASVGALLLKVWGVMPMQQAFLWLTVPAILFVLWLWRRRGPVGEAISVGFAAGLVASIAYDLARIPFVIAGMRVFATISIFGVWLLDVPTNSNLTETAGWLYHYSNGISFGIMYALFGKGRHWGWAVVWACALETLALASPFGAIFGFTGDWKPMGIAYLGHVAYGIPLGRMVRNWQSTCESLDAMPRRVQATLTLAAIGAIGWMLHTANPVVKPASFEIDGVRLVPDIQRIARGSSIEYRNAGAPAPVMLAGREWKVENRLAVPMDRPGIYQTWVRHEGRSRSSFVIVEPVEESR